MYTVYGISNCDTVKKALDWLKANRVEFEFHDYKKKGIDRKKLEEWLTQYPWEQLVNRAGRTWKQLPEEEKATDAESAIRLMLEKNSVIKRPIVEKVSIKALGFDAEKYKVL
jgi:arsenate reductase (glutaredoxin)